MGPHDQRQGPISRRFVHVARRIFGAVKFSHLAHTNSWEDFLGAGECVLEVRAIRGWIMAHED